MREQLLSKLRTYLVDNNMDLFLELQDSRQLTSYLNDRLTEVIPILTRMQEEGHPDLVIEEVCFARLTAPLKPSRYNYVLSVLENEFEADYEKLREAGILTYEVVNMVKHCKGEFDEFGLNEENEDSWYLRYSIIGGIRDYLDQQT